MLGGQRAGDGEQIVSTPSRQFAWSHLLALIYLKDPEARDFLGLRDRHLVRDFEDAILRELEAFLLELGPCFGVVARQRRIQRDIDDFDIDRLAAGRKTCTT